MGNAKIIIRPEQSGDESAIYHVNREAFGQPEEAVLVDELRADGALTVSLVAILDGEIVGHIAFSPMTFEPPGKRNKAIGLAPLAVLPDYQRKGIGLRLIQAGLDACRKAGHDVCIVLGHPNYYPRAGFVRASLHGISSDLDVPDEVFMVVELQPDTLKDYKGRVTYHPAFQSV